MIHLTGGLFANEIDSLRKLIATQPLNAKKIELLNALSKSYFNDNPDTSVTIASETAKLAEKIADSTGLALAYKNMGIGYYLQGKYKEAVLTWNQAIEVYKLLGDKKGVANMLSNEGAVYFNQGDDAKALELHLASLKMSEEIDDTLRILTSLINIGSVYTNKQATYDKALEYCKRAYVIAKRLQDQYLIGTCTANLGEIYFKLNDDNTALIYLKESIKAYEGTEDAPYSMNYLGKVYQRQKKFDMALKIHQEAFAIAEKLDTKLDMSQSLIGMAQTYFAKGDYDEAIISYKNALNIALALNANQEVKDAYEGLSQSYAAKNNFLDAYNYQALLLSIKDTIYNINTDKKLGVLQFTFDLEKKQGEVNLLTKDKELKEQEIKRQKMVRNSFIGGFAVVLIFAGVFLKQRMRISKEKKRSDELLLNILPGEVAEELKEKGSAEAKQINEVTVLFTDFKGFTQLSEKLSPKELVAEINECFSAFDHIMQKHNVEKIKTIGDAYMAAGGLPTPNNTHAVDVVNAALEIQSFMQQLKEQKQAQQKLYFEIRIGIHTGPVVAGIVGVKKFAYDIWGDTVNTASRMESSGEVGKVNISETTFDIVKDHFSCEYRGEIEAKGKGKIKMYFVKPPVLV
jgi:class 3 adenylate cyclase/lipopolysaccharide biosynthesis regulator YciM